MTQFENNLKEARSLYDSGNFDEASKMYLKVLNDSKNNSESAIIWAELCWTFYKMQSYKQAVEAAENVLLYDSAYPKREEIYRLQGYSYLGLGNEDAAEEYLKKSLQIDNNSESQQYILYELGKIYFKNQNYKEAEIFFDRVEEYFKENVFDFWTSVLFFKGFIKYYIKEIQESESVFQKLLENAKDPITQSNANYGLAYITFEKKDYLQTINLCENITRQNPQFYDMESLGFLMASSFFYLGRYDVFEMYHNQMQKNYTNGRYNSELSKLYEQIPNKKDPTQKN